MKNIIFCADGTWNGTDRDSDGDGLPDVTNVARLFSALDGSITAETLRLHDEQERELAGPAGLVQVAKYMTASAIRATRSARSSAACSARV